MPSPQPFAPEYFFTNSLELPVVRSYYHAFFLHQKYVVEGLTPAQIAADNDASHANHYSAIKVLFEHNPGDTCGQNPF